jgi:hypothetical protein
MMASLAVDPAEEALARLHNTFTAICEPII